METHRRYLEEQKRKSLHVEILRILTSQQSVLIKASDLERIIERERLVSMTKQSEGNFLN